MASLDASSSLGAAIGLTGTPKDYSMDFLRAGQAQQKIAQTAKKNAAADDAKAMKAFQVKPGKYLNSRTKLIEKIGADMYEAVRDAQRRGVDPASDPDTRNKEYQTRVKLQKYQQEYDNYIADRQMYEKDPKNNKLNEDIANKYAGDLQLDEDIEPYQKGAAVGFTGDVVQYLMKAGAEVGESVDINKYTSNGTLRTEEYLKAIDENNKALAKDIYTKTLAGSNRFGQVLLEEVKGELADKITYQNASDEQKAQMETDLFLSKAENTIKIPQREKISKSTIQDKEIQKKEWKIGSGGSSIETDIYRIDLISEGVKTKDNKIVPEKITISSIQKGVGGAPNQIRVRVAKKDKKGNTVIEEVQGYPSEWKFDKAVGRYRPYLTVPRINEEGRQTTFSDTYQVIDDDYRKFAGEVGIDPWQVIEKLPGHKTYISQGGATSPKTASAKTEAPKTTSTPKKTKKYNPATGKIE